jgi:hypothetical protein
LEQLALSTYELRDMAHARNYKVASDRRYIERPSDGTGNARVNGDATTVAEADDEAGLE